MENFKFLLKISTLIFWLSSQVQAQQTSLIEVKLATLQVSSSYSAFVYFQGDTRNLKRLQTALDKGNEVLTSLNVPSSELHKKWQQSIEHINSIKAYQFDGSDIGHDVKWSLLQKDLNAELVKLEGTSKEAAGSDSTFELLTLQLKMENLLSQYMTFSNAITGSYGSIRNEIPFEQQVENITTGLASFEVNNKNINKVRSKWKYIKKTLLAYNSNVAPFVVLHTYDKIRSEINAYLVANPNRQRVASE
jgi:hypothetical protein